MFYMSEELARTIQAITGILGLIAIGFLWWQIRSTLKWNKINISLGKINFELLNKSKGTIAIFGIDMEVDKEIEDDEFNELIDEKNIKVLNEINEILGMFEGFAALYNMNAMNKYFAYELYSDEVMFYYKKFKKIIDYYCILDNDPFYYKNFEKCANEFIRIRNYELKKFEKLRQKEIEKTIRSSL